MKIKEINIKNFRNYDNLNLKINKNINIFVGQNAQGKTNLIESIYLAGITKSYRTYIEKNLIKTDKEFSKINIKTSTDEFNIILTEKGKSLKINNKIIKKTSDYISNLRIVIFSPEDLEIIKGNPSYRRKFLNIEISQTDKKYLIVLNEYQKILKERNEYLKTITEKTIDNTYMDILNTQLSEKANIIFEYRKSFINKINEKIKKFSKEMFNEIIYIIYKPSVEKDYKKQLEQTIKKDIILKTTNLGPHRDDFEFNFEDKNIKTFFSQGQQRMTILCLKLSEIEILKEQFKNKPIFLLDDIFSELDKQKQNNIIKILNKDIQTFITTVDINNIEDTLIKEADIYEIEDSKIKKIN